MGYWAGALSLILGVLSFRHFGGAYAIWLFALWIGIGFVFRGVAVAASAISHRELPARAWAIFLGVISPIAGLVVLAWPFDSIAVLAIVAGIWLVIIGMTEIVSAFATRNDLKKAGKAMAGMAQGGPQRQPEAWQPWRTGSPATVGLPILHPYLKEGPFLQCP